MAEKAVKEIVIVGNSSTGWVASYMLMSMLGRTGIKIKYVHVRNQSKDTINSVSNFHDIFQLLKLVNIDLENFFRICSAIPFVGYRYSDNARTVSFVHSFSGYDKSYGRCASDDVIPFFNKIIPEMGYQDFSLSAQMAEEGKFFALGDLILNPNLLSGKGVSFSEDKFLELLASVHSENHFERFECQNITVDINSENIVEALHVDDMLLGADLYLDCTGQDRKIIKYISDVKNLAAIGFSRTVTDDTGVVKKPVIECVISASGLLKKERVVGSSQITEFRIDGCGLQNFIPYITSSPWSSNVVAVGDASGSVCNIALSELDIAINQIKLLVECFPRSTGKNFNKQYFNKVVQDQLFWIFQFNWLAINFQMTVADDEPTVSVISMELFERLLAFKKTGFVFTEDNEIFSDLFWKSFLLGNKYVYDGGFDTFSDGCGPILDLLQEKIRIHKSLSGMSSFVDFYK